MKLLKTLYQDETGYILSAEAVLLGTVGVVGATVGLGAVSNSLNDELTEVAYAFRSLDQSYSIEGQTGCGGCGAWTAGSSFTQQDAELSRAELREWVEEQRQGTDAPNSRSDKEKHEKKMRRNRTRDAQPRRDRESDERIRKSESRNRNVDGDSERQRRSSEEEKTIRKRRKKQD